jgi:predicted HD superfamily hydrolase involved in NAD metabolism
VVSQTYATAERALSERLSSDAFAHCVRTAETAAGLALEYGADVEIARLAGLLHDWDREISKRELVSSALERGMHVTDVEHASPKLLHARTGAAAVRDEYPHLPEEVYSAVEKHTVGAPQMSDVDRIVYLADMIEPGREWPGVVELRDAVGVVSLPELFFRGYAASLHSLVSRRRRLHPDTVSVWNGLVDAAEAGGAS